MNLYTQLPHEDLLNKISLTHLVCVPSIDAEMCPLIVLEAQSMGKTVLGSNHTGIADLIQDFKLEGPLSI